MKRTERGFAIYTEFRDLYGLSVRVQKSSLATKDAVWIFPEIHKHHVDGEALCGAHLDRRLARRVIKALQAFLDGKA